jgi:hypothetical protein
MTPFDATGHTNKDRPNSPKSSATCGARLPLLAVGVVYLFAEPVYRYDHLRVLHNTLISAVLLRQTVDRVVVSPSPHQRPWQQRTQAAPPGLKPLRHCRSRLARSASRARPNVRIRPLARQKLSRQDAIFPDASSG